MAVPKIPKKKIKAIIKLNVKAGQANPAPPVGPALGQNGVNIMEFCKAFNAHTEALIKKDELKLGMPVPVVITVGVDRSFTFITKTPPTSVLICEELGIAKGSGTPNTVKVGHLTCQQLEKLAKRKMADLSAADMQTAINTVAGTARSMGVTVEEAGSV